MEIGTLSSSTTTTASTTTTTGNIVSKDDFLLLLVTQMKNQNPLEPMKDSEFLAQLAQFSSLEQLQNLSQQADINQAYALLGKEVGAISGNEVLTGVVERVWIENGVPYLLIGEYAAKLQEVVMVALHDTSSNQNGNDEASDNNGGSDDGE